MSDALASLGEEYSRENVEQLLRALASVVDSSSRGGGNHGGIDGDSTNVWRTIALGALSLNAGLLVWGLATLVQLKEDVAVLRCQVNPAFCLKVASGSK